MPESTFINTVANCSLALGRNLYVTVVTCANLEGPKLLSEAEKEKFGYEIHVVEKEVVVTYFADALDFSNAPFISFVPKYKIDIHDKGEVSGEVLVFPSHLVEKIIRRIK